MKKISKFAIGMIFSIPVFENEIVFGRMLRSDKFIVYNKKFQLVEIEEHKIAEEEIIELPVLFYTSIYEDALKRDVFKYYGTISVFQKELDKVPPVFTQDIINKNDCMLYYFDGRIEATSPDQCIGLEYFAVWEPEGVIKRIEDYYNGIENFNVKNGQVRL